RARWPRDLFSIPRGQNKVRGRAESILRHEPKRPTAASPKKRETNDAKECIAASPYPTGDSKGIHFIFVGILMFAGSSGCGTKLNQYEVRLVRRVPEQGCAR